MNDLNKILEKYRNDCFLAKDAGLNETAINFLALSTIQTKEELGKRFYQQFLKEYLSVSPKGYHNGEKAKLAAKKAAGL